MSAMLAALSADRGASVTELSGRAELGRSTAARVLTTLEGMGFARRERPDRSADHSSPDLWFTVAIDQTQPDAAGDESADHTPETEPDAQSSAIPSQAEIDDLQPAPNGEPEDAAVSADARDCEGADGPAAQTHDEAEPDGDPDPEPGADPEPAVDGAATDAAPGQETQAQSDTADAPGPDADTAPDSGSGTGAGESENADTAASSGTGATVRLGKGELRALVLKHLTAHPEEEFTASKVGKALNKSSGAVANVFDALVKTGEAEMTCEKPRRFRHLAKAAH
jgi:hypothetical protein